MKRSKKIPLWLRRIDLVKAEMKLVRYPRTAQEGFRQCAELSETALRWFKHPFEIAILEPARRRSRKNGGCCWRASAPPKHAG